jgi:hypothetical protein
MTTATANSIHLVGRVCDIEGPRYADEDVIAKRQAEHFNCRAFADEVFSGPGTLSAARE